MATAPSVSKARQQNIEHLVQIADLRARLAQVTGWDEELIQAYASGKRKIVDDAASNVEFLLGMPQYWLDSPHAWEDVLEQTLMVLLSGYKRGFGGEFQTNLELAFQTAVDRKEISSSLLGMLEALEKARGKPFDNASLQMQVAKYRAPKKSKVSKNVEDVLTAPPPDAVDAATLSPASEATPNGLEMAKANTTTEDCEKEKSLSGVFLKYMEELHELKAKFNQSGSTKLVLIQVLTESISAQLRHIREIRTFEERQAATEMQLLHKQMHELIAELPSAVKEETVKGNV